MKSQSVFKSIKELNEFWTILYFPLCISSFFMVEGIEETFMS